MKANKRLKNNWIKTGDICFVCNPEKSRKDLPKEMNWKLWIFIQFLYSEFNDFINLNMFSLYWNFKILSCSISQSSRNMEITANQKATENRCTWE